MRKFFKQIFVRFQAVGFGCLNKVIEKSGGPGAFRSYRKSSQPEGAAATAAMYTIIETAKANNLEPYKYLYYLFNELPLAQSIEGYKNYYLKT